MPLNIHASMQYAHDEHTVVCRPVKQDVRSVLDSSQAGIKFGGASPEGRVLREKFEPFVQARKMATRLFDAPVRRACSTPKVMIVYS